jgi:hypothetical protein
LSINERKGPAPAVDLTTPPVPAQRDTKRQAVRAARSSAARNVPAYFPARASGIHSRRLAGPLPSYRIENIASLNSSGGDAILECMKSETAPDTLVPPGLLPEIQAAAQEEHREPSELVGEAVERYLRQKRWQKVYARGEQRAREMGLTEEDIPRLIAEYRQEQRQGR